MAWDHPWVDELLSRWGDWVRAERRQRIAQSRYSLEPPTPSEAIRSWVPIDDLECLETDRFVTSLAEPWVRVVKAYYCSDAGVESKARSVGMSTRTFYAHVRQVHLRYLTWQEDRKALAERRRAA